MLDSRTRIFLELLCCISNNAIQALYSQVVFSDLLKKRTKALKSFRVLGERGEEEGVHCIYMVGARNYAEG